MNRPCPPTRNLCVPRVLCGYHYARGRHRGTSFENGESSLSEAPLDLSVSPRYRTFMKRSRNWWFALCFAFALNVRGAEFPDEWTWDKDSQARAQHAALEGKKMPGLDLADWVNGQVKPEGMKGKVVVVDFYATWCGPCMAAIPHNNELLRKYKDKGLVIVGVCTSKQGQEKMEQTVKDRGIAYPTARDPQFRSEEAWQVRAGTRG